MYEALTQKEALEFWLAPDQMTGKIHDFDLSVGGGYTMSLFYTDNSIKGKTSGNEDRYTSTFIELQPYEKVVHSITFQSEKKEFEEAMIMEVFLEEKGKDVTNVTIFFKNIPAGITPEDNEAGTKESLDKLARYLENNNRSASEKK